MELLVIHSTLRARSQGNEHRQRWAEAEAGCDCTSFRTFHRLLNSERAMATDDRVPLPLARGSHQSSPDWQRSIEKDEGSRSPQRPCAPSTQQKYRGVEFPSGQVFCLLLYQYVSFSFSLWLPNQLRRTPHCSVSAVLPSMNCHCALQPFLVWVTPELGHNP